MPPPVPGRGQVHEAFEELEREPNQCIGKRRNLEEQRNDDDQNEDGDLGSWESGCVGAEHAGNRAGSAKHRHGEVHVEIGMCKARDEPAGKVEAQETPPADAPFERGAEDRTASTY